MVLNLTRFPFDLAGREAVRQQYRDKALAEVAMVGRTITCQKPHVALHVTCLGAGVCLCPCHDPIDERGGS